MKTKRSRFDRLVAQYYPGGFQLCQPLKQPTSGEAIALTRGAFYSTRKEAENLRNSTAIALIRISAVIRTGLATA